MGSVYALIPEWNLSEISELGSDYLLDHLKHRATKSLCQQYRQGVHLVSSGFHSGEVVCDVKFLDDLGHLLGAGRGDNACWSKVITCNRPAFPQLGAIIQSAVSPLGHFGRRAWNGFPLLLSEQGRKRVRGIERHPLRLQPPGVSKGKCLLIILPFPSSLYMAEGPLSSRLVSLVLHPWRILL